jgi:hypothetical protein
MEMPMEQQTQLEVADNILSVMTKNPQITQQEQIILSAIKQLQSVRHLTIDLTTFVPGIHMHLLAQVSKHATGNVLIDVIEKADGCIDLLIRQNKQ